MRRWSQTLLGWAIWLVMELLILILICFPLPPPEEDIDIPPLDLEEFH